MLAGEPAGSHGEASRSAASAAKFSSDSLAPEASPDAPRARGLPGFHPIDTSSLKDPTDSALRRAGIVMPIVADDMRLPDPAAMERCERDSFEARTLSSSDVSAPTVLSALGFRRTYADGGTRARCRIADVSPTFLADGAGCDGRGSGGRNWRVATGPSASSAL